MRRKLGFLIFILVSLIFSVVSCSSQKYGKEIDPSVKKVTVQEVYSNQSLKGQKVVLEGRIITQCQSRGCWFFLNDNTGSVFINLEPMGVNLPPKMGKKVTVMGIVSGSDNNPVINATGLLIH